MRAGRGPVKADELARPGADVRLAPPGEEVVDPPRAYLLSLLARQQRGLALIVAARELAGRRLEILPVGGPSGEREADPPKRFGIRRNEIQKRPGTGRNRSAGNQRPARPGIPRPFGCGNLRLPAPAAALPPPAAPPHH